VNLDLIGNLAKPAKSKIVLLVLDGLGGLPGESGLTELEAAETPRMDALAATGICGLHEPIGPGITPGSGPSHLSLFGYDPVEYQVGRGVLSALGLDFDLAANDVAARGNFCTLDGNGLVVDRRAGRISTQKNAELCDLLRDIEVPGARVFLQPEKEHRVLIVLRGENLSGDISDTDPQDVGKAPLEPRPLTPEAEPAARLVSSFLRQARERLAREHPANMVLLRGFSKRPDWPTMGETFRLRPAAVAAYPMYRGVAKLVGMDVVPAGEKVGETFAAVAARWNDFDFFYVHVKRTDSAGEDGDFAAKVAVIEEVDRQLPMLLDLQPDVFVVTGDHSTPANMKAHSWHPVPVMLWSRNCRPDAVGRFGERACMTGALGANLPTVALMPLMLANALRLDKYGA
jgi:2,3-bisphosphoglycerate-independent phosphoglycerate mutase